MDIDKPVAFKDSFTGPESSVVNVLDIQRLLREVPGDYNDVAR